MTNKEAEKRFRERIKRYYHPGTRIMLLSMGDDLHPVEDNTRGTVRIVDNLGTLHCDFDDGRSFGIVPGEDKFRRLTDEELAEEKNQNMDEVEDNTPIMIL